MDSRTGFVLLWMLLSYTSTGIKLDGNGYVDIVFVISSDIPEDDMLIDKIKDMVTEGSVHLYKALDKKVYFKEVTILVPFNWNGKGFARARTELFEKGRIRIDNPHPAYGDEPYTNQYGECGAEGQYIHFTPNFLRNDTFIQLYGSKGKVFVHEWAHLRWGVYDEYSEKTPFYRSANGNIEATRCSENIEGQLRDVSTDQLCHNDPQTSLPTEGCKFIPNKDSSTNSSMMFFPSMDSVITFCRKSEHNYEAPNMQNAKCSNKATWTVIFEDSLDKDALSSLQPLESTPPEPTFKVVQRMQRTVCLVLDISGSMQGSRIIRLQQAADYFIRNIIEDQSSLGIVTFNTDASTLSTLTTIDKESTRDNLSNLLPKVTGGSTNMCKGLNLGLQVLKMDNEDVLGDEIVFLTDGEATDNIRFCVPAAISSGAIIHTIALGNKADKALREMADKTGGKFITASDDVLSNQLLNGFSSLTMPTGNQTKDPVQIDSVGEKISGWFNGTVLVDRTIGSKTSFTITYEASLPRISIQSPNGSIFNQTQMHHENLAKTVSLKIPGIAQPGDWKYSILSPRLQVLTVTATSYAAHANVPPITVKAHTDKQFSDGVESESGSAAPFQLLDNGIGADAFKDDGVYSRYYTQMKEGRSSLKVSVKSQDGQARFTLQKRGGAPYVPGYVVDGVVELNPPKPSVSEELQEVESFTRTATGESFEVMGSITPNFPPNKITDLSAEIQDDAVLLSWTAPGEDLDQGTAESYQIRWSFDLKMLQQNFSDAHPVDTSAVSPQVFGSVEQHAFNLSLPIQNGTTLFFAIQSQDEQNAKSETSNIASASKILPSPILQEISNPGLNWNVFVTSLFVVTMIICFIAGVITWAVRRRRSVLI
ncbi:calcium-activated chloride channel regulator 1-like isoform X2 [Danio aesculapii]|uniref:calcium-activated chloride channel regulator 1-like isoform X2 n=1 Tax=Danio aesculapii TaxID=1142201 RepID=UPI0024C08A93|nr:calcium-activated chloride channel regulator 1-like isoform X2 [Danio aesculapii]